MVVITFLKITKIHARDIGVCSSTSEEDIATTPETKPRSHFFVYLIMHCHFLINKYLITFN